MWTTARRSRSDRTTTPTRKEHEATPEIEKLYEHLRGTVKRVLGHVATSVVAFPDMQMASAALDDALAPQPQPKVGQWWRVRALPDRVGVVCEFQAYDGAQRVGLRGQNMYYAYPPEEVEPCHPDWTVMHPNGPPVPGSKVQVVEHPVCPDGQTRDEADLQCAGRTLVVLGTGRHANEPWVIECEVENNEVADFWPWNCRPLSEDAK